MPHACTICTSCSFSNAFIIDIGTADPPQVTSRSDEMSWPASVSRQCSTSFQIVGTAAAIVGRCVSIRSISDFASRNRSVITSSAPAINAAVRHPPRVGVEHRHDGKHLVGRTRRPTALAVLVIIACR